MWTFAQKQKANQQAMSRSFAIPGCLQPTIKNLAVRRLSGTTTGNVQRESTATVISRFSRDFSRIPAQNRTSLKIQAKLTVSSPGDQYEQEADQIADSVMAGCDRPVGQVSRGVQPKLYRVELRPEDMVDSMPPFGEELGAEPPGLGPTEEVQRSASGEAGSVTPRFEQSLQQTIHAGGETLPSPVQLFMESRFGWDFSSVRVYRDARAQTLAREANARAFTLGNDIFFARSQYQPYSVEGQRLLAHELTHVVQQSEGRLSRQIQRLTSCSSYPGYNSSAALDTYNCAGLATRTYQDISPPSAVYDTIAAHFRTPHSPSGGKCAAGRVKFWLWQYNMHMEDNQGTILSPDRRDFHIVAGRVDVTGADPTDVYSKNGHRRVHGPGTGPGFQPAGRERALSNDASETPGTINGRPAFKVRSNMSEEISCAECYP